MKDSIFSIIKHILFTGLILFSTTFLFAQTQSISPKKLTFDRICAGGPHPDPDKVGQIFNEFQAAFKISGFPPATTFVVELSDNLGSFTNPVSTTTLPHNTITGTPPDTATDITLTFAVPTNLVGSGNYELRIKPSVGVPSQIFTSAANTKSFSAYFKAFNGSFYINNQSANVAICNGGSVTLSVDNPTPTITNSSPANYPNLKYRWYKDASVIQGETSSAITISTTGAYYAEIDYGACTDANFRSQSVTVSVASGAVATITSSLGNFVCSDGAATTLSTESGQSYQWFKNNIAIQGATSFQYQTNLAGLYSVAVNSGSCASAPSIDLKELLITGSINVPSVSTIKVGETLNVIATTDATSPTYEWYRNDTVIIGASGSSYEVTEDGNYKVIISQASACTILKEIPFVIRYPIVDSNAVNIPNLISPNGDGINDTWVLPQEYTSGSNTEVLVINSQGEIVLKTNDYFNNWPENLINFKNVTPVYYYIITTQDKKTKKGSITVLK